MKIQGIGRCPNCGDRIRWFRTQAGRAVPLDGNVSMTRDYSAKLYAEDGSPAQAPSIPGEFLKGYALHSIKCPDMIEAARWRK